MGWRHVIGAVLDKAESAAQPSTATPTAQRPRKPRQAEERREPTLDEPGREGPEHSWSGKVFDQIEWRRFEAVCEALFTQGGLRAETSAQGHDL